MLYNVVLSWQNISRFKFSWGLPAKQSRCKAIFSPEPPKKLPNIIVYEDYF
jgi:hypothetical protein